MYHYIIVELYCPGHLFSSPLPSLLEIWCWPSYRLQFKLNSISCIFYSLTPVHCITTNNHPHKYSFFLTYSFPLYFYTHFLHLFYYLCLLFSSLNIFKPSESIFSHMFTDIIVHFYTTSYILNSYSVASLCFPLSIIITALLYCILFSYLLPNILIQIYVYIIAGLATVL